MKAYRPTKEALLAVAGKTVPDAIATGLRVLFCGINPGLYSAVVGHHFARLGNLFWPTLHAADFTDRVLSPWDERELLHSGVPEPSGLNAHYQAEDLARLFRELRLAIYNEPRMA